MRRAVGLKRSSFYGAAARFCLKSNACLTCSDTKLTQRYHGLNGNGLTDFPPGRQGAACWWVCRGRRSPDRAYVRESDSAQANPSCASTPGGSGSSCQMGSLRGRSRAPASSRCGPCIAQTGSLGAAGAGGQYEGPRFLPATLG